MTTWFNNMKLRNKLFLSILLVVLVPVLFVGMFLTAQFRQMALENAVQQTASNVERLKQRTSDIIKIPLIVSERLLFDRRLKTVSNSRYDTVLDVFKAYSGYSDFRDFLKTYAELKNIRLYIDNPTLINNWEFIQPDDSIRHSFWYRAAIADNAVRWYYVEDQAGKNKYLSLVRRIDFPEYGTKGVLVIAVNPVTLHAIMNQEPYETMIIDENNNIVASNNPALSGKLLTDASIGRIIQNYDSGTYEEIVDGKLSKIIIENVHPASSLNGLRIVSVFAVDYIVAEADRIGTMGMIVIFLSCIVAVILISLVSALISKRILKLSKEINKVAAGNLNAYSPIDGNDEIAQLSRQFNSMVRSIRELMDEVYESNRQKSMMELKQKEIKLKMMASQINPHFLFNALESIRMKAHINGQSEIAQTVRLLGKLMRKNLEIGGADIRFGDEMEIVRCYLEIQKFRYADRLTFTLDIEPETTNIPVPPLIVQPLVENAVIHGLENLEQGGHVRISAALTEDGMLRIDVEDNGDGMDEARRQAVLAAMEDAEDRGEQRIGLRNIHQRLRLTYGEAYRYDMVSEPGRGTRIRLELPARGRERNV
ncbi:sensor histidine kinase [Paenibacillus cisolokensis]|uniref:sensor histidine kinase n=1 Tax=Paenibacillus cisolokensis TaxID=1658519 RepID=UPI003D28BE8F